MDPQAPCQLINYSTKVARLESRRRGQRTVDSGLVHFTNQRSLIRWGGEKTKHKQAEPATSQQMEGDQARDAR